MNDTDISPLAPTVAIPAPASTLARPSLSSLATTSASALASSSSEAVPPIRRINRIFVGRYPGMSRFDLYERPRVDPPPKAPRPVKRRKPKPEGLKKL